jgi:hypothetical protein
VTISLIPKTLVDLSISSDVSPLGAFFACFYIVFLIFLTDLKILDKIVKKSLYKRTQQRDSLLKAIMSGADQSNKYCSYYILKNHRDCLVSPLDLSHYFKCVYLNKSYCDI